MTLDEAIDRTRDKALEMYRNQDTRKYWQDHMQIAKWLEELKAYKAKYPDFKSENDRYLF